MKNPYLPQNPPIPVKNEAHNLGLQSLHLLAEAIGLAYADRFRYMGDPEFISVPLRGLASKAYAEELRGRISLEKALELSPGGPWPYEECTTA